MSRGERRKKMGSCCSETQPLMILTIILILFSLNSCVMSVVNDGDDSSSSSYFLSLSHNAYPPESFDGYIPIEKVSGEDENENDKANRERSLFEGFRVLLGLKSFHYGRGSKGGQNGHSLSPSLSPSPSPFRSDSESPSPSPSLPPLSHIHVKPHPGNHGFHSLPKPQKVQQEDEKGKAKAKAKRVLIAVLVSTGVAILLCVAFLILAWNKYKRHHNKPKIRNISVMYGKSISRGRSNYKCGVMSSKKKQPSSSSITKVSQNPALDLFYLESLGKDLEQPHQAQAFSCLKQACETQSHTTHNAALSKPEFDDASSSSTREITSVHEDFDSVNDDHYDCLTFPSGGKIVPIEEGHSSEGDDEEDDDGNESFHSFGESNSSNVIRLSNASLGSFSDALENFNSNEANKSPSLSLPIRPSSIPTQNPYLESQRKSKPTKFDTTNFSSIGPNNLKPPSPPPPPPPPPPLAPPRTNFLPSCPPNFSTQIHAKPSTSSTLPNPPSPKEQNKQISNLASPPSNVPKPHPPPPPPFKVNAPPPPPPLPFKVNGPPPPPSQLPQSPPMGKDGSPLPKLKPLHWDKVRAAPDQSMVWDKIRSSSFEFDEEMIESLFGYNLQNSMKNEEAKSKTPSPSKHILEPKRLQNITILSKALNVTSQQVCDAMLRGNGLSLQQLEALVKMEPTKEEEAKLRGYKGDVTELGSAERFVKAMLNIPFAFQRLQAMLYKETFDDEVVHLRNSFSMLEEACKELRSSRLFLKLLEAVLKTGNRMNVGTIRGGARAFKLDALLKLADVKGTDGKTSLLHFVVQEMIRSEGLRASDSIIGRIASQATPPRDAEDLYRSLGLDLVSGLPSELLNVKRTAAADLDVLGSSVSTLSEGAGRLRALCGALGNGDGFGEAMRGFVVGAERRLGELREAERVVMERVKEVTEYFHGSSSVVIGKQEAVNPLRIFVIVRDFLAMLDQVCKELRTNKTPRSPNPLAPFRITT